MSSTAASLAAEVCPGERVEVLFEELAELAGQRNAIDGRIVAIVAELDRDELWGATGARSVAALVAWKTGTSLGNALTLASVAHRLEEFPRCAAGLRDGRLSLDRPASSPTAPPGDPMSTTPNSPNPRRSASCAPRSNSHPAPNPPPNLNRSGRSPKPPTHGSASGRSPCCTPAAIFDAALASHHDALITDWKRDHDHGDPISAQAPPLPTTVDAFISLIEDGWDTEVTRRPHGQRTTVVAHVNLDTRVACLHLGPLLSDDERRYLTCDATCEVWFERHGQVIGAGRATRTVSRRLRRALEHRDHCCVVPGCGATRGLHAHHIRHWEDGGRTELDNLVLVCPYHHRSHHRRIITITGPAGHLTVTDSAGRPLRNGSLARPPTTPPPAVAPYPGPTGERADWWWYEPFQPQPPPSTN